MNYDYRGMPKLLQEYNVAPKEYLSLPDEQKATYLAYLKACYKSDRESVSLREWLYIYAHKSGVTPIKDIATELQITERQVTVALVGGIRKIRRIILKDKRFRDLRGAI